MNTNDIINYVNDIKNQWQTNDPYAIADYLGITVLHTATCIKSFTAQTIKVNGYPTIISINDAYTEFSKKVLCAHELGHALLHQECVNLFAITNSNIATSVEQEANLFAIALLASDETINSLDVPLTSMNNYLLKTIMDYNLELE